MLNRYWGIVTVLRFHHERAKGILWRKDEDKFWTCSVQVFEEMVVNRFWTVTWMLKPPRAAGGLRRTRLFFEGRGKVVSRWRATSRDFSAFFVLDIWSSKTGCLCDICVVVDILWTMWEGMCSNKYILFQTSKETVFLIKRYQEIPSQF